MNPGAPTGQAAITAASGNSVRTAAAPTGSQLLKDRQALHSEMKKGVTPDMQERAKTLGITEASWKRVAGKMPHTMAMMPGAKQGGGMPNATPATPANYQGAVQGGAGGKPYGSEYKAPDEFAGSSLVYRNRTRLFAPNPSEVVKRKVPHPSDSTNFEIPTANIDPGQGITKALRKS